jgi:transposase InsO family protein
MALVRKYGWRRSRFRVHPAKPKVGLRTATPDEMWHIDTTVIRLLDGTRAYVHAIIDDFSRRIVAWRVADRSAAVNSVTVLLEAIARATRSAPAPVVLADAGVENVNAQVDALIDTGVRMIFGAGYSDHGPRIRVRLKTRTGPRIPRARCRAASGLRPLFIATQREASSVGKNFGHGRE